MDAFEGADVEDLFAMHYSPLENRLVAEFILDHLNNISNQENLFNSTAKGVM